MDTKGSESVENTEEEAEQLPTSHLRLSLLKLQLASSSELFGVILFLEYKTLNNS